MFDSSKVVFRNYLSEKDLPHLVAVRELCIQHDQIDPLSTLESIPTVQELKNSFNDDNCDPFKDVLVVEYQDKVIGYAKVCWWIENDGTVVFLHLEYLDPEFRQKYLWQKIINWVEQKTKEKATSISASKKVFAANASTTEKDKTKILIENKYRRVFSLVEMVFDDYKILDKSSLLPQGFVLKEVSESDLRSVWELNNIVYQNRDFISQQTEDDFKIFASNSNNDFSLWKVAYFDNEIAGFVIGSVTKNRGEIEEVSILPKYRRKGLAFSLLNMVLQEFENKKIEKVYLHTNGENVSGARSLYKKIGFKHLKDFVKYRKNLV